MGKIRIVRKAHIRKGYIKDVKPGPGVKKRYIKPTRVKKTVYLAKDRGKKGRGPKIVKITRPGTLGGAGFFKKSRATQQRILRAAVRKYGERSVQGKLAAIQALTKRTNPSVSREARILRTWVAKQYGTYRGKY